MVKSETFFFISCFLARNTYYKLKVKIMEETRFTNFKKRISWGSISAGVITVLSISILLSMLGTSIGLFMFNPTADDPTSGIGATISIWTIISLIVSLLAGGFVAGKLAGNDGIIHGFLVWSSTVIITVIIGAFLTMGAVKLTANILGSLSSVTGSILSGVGSAAGNGASALSDQVKSVFDNIDFNTDDDNENLPANIRTALKKSGVKELQPQYLQNQMAQVKEDLDKSVKKLVTHPKDADQIINNFLDRLQKRANKLADNINRDDVTKAIANNTNMSKAEVDEAVNQYIDLTNTATRKGKEQIQKLQQTVENAKQELQEMKQKALEETKEASKAAARTALISFFAMLVGAVICAIAGLYGTRKTREGYEI